MTSAARASSAAATHRQRGRCASEELEEIPSLHVPLLRRWNAPMPKSISSKGFCGCEIEMVRVMNGSAEDSE